MKRRCLTPALSLSLLLLFGAQVPRSVPSLAQTLQASRWHQRVLLLAAPTAAQADFQAQKAQLAAHAAGLAERDVLVLDLLADQLSAADQQFLARTFNLKSSAFAAVLIGKDGGVKRRSARPLTPAELFETVDQMPMRRQEMRRGARP